MHTSDKVFLVLPKPEKPVRLFGTGVTDSCKPLLVCRKVNTGPLQRAVCAFNRPIAPASGLHFDYHYTFPSLIPLNSMELSKLGDVTHPAML